MKRIVKLILKKLFTHLVKKKAAICGKDLRVHNFCKVTSRTYLGDNVNFNGIKISGKAKITIGNNFHSGEGCYIISSNHNFNGGTAIPYDNTYVSKDVVIEDNVWIGVNVVILAGVRIGEGAIIQAGSVVIKDVPKYAIAGGHPAKVFSKRNIDHYLDLKEKKAFF